MTNRNHRHSHDCGHIAYGKWSNEGNGLYTLTEIVDGVPTRKVEGLTLADQLATFTYENSRGPLPLWVRYLESYGVAC